MSSLNHKVNTDTDEKSQVKTESVRNPISKPGIERDGANNIDDEGIDDSSNDDDNKDYLRDPDAGNFPKPKNFLHKVQLVWEVYRWTWEGFFDNKEKESKKEEDDEDDNETDYEELIDSTGNKLHQTQQQIKGNVKRNVNVLKTEGQEVLDVVKDVTGIRNKRDIKAWAMDQLKLANVCVAEFMKGYRYGRDEEIDKMMNEYFKDIDFDEEDDDDGNENKDKKNDGGEDKATTGRKRRTRRPRVS